MTLQLISVIIANLIDIQYYIYDFEVLFPILLGNRNPLRAFRVNLPIGVCINSVMKSPLEHRPGAFLFAFVQVLRRPLKAPFRGLISIKIGMQPDERRICPYYYMFVDLQSFFLVEKTVSTATKHLPNAVGTCTHIIFGNFFITFICFIRLCMVLKIINTIDRLTNKKKEWKPTQPTT